MGWTCLILLEYLGSSNINGPQLPRGFLMLVKEFPKEQLKNAGMRRLISICTFPSTNYVLIAWVP